MKQPRDLSQIISRIAQAEQWRDSNFKEDWRRWLRQYRSRPEQRREGSNIFVPYTFMVVETIKSRIVNSIFASRPYLTMLPVGAGDSARSEKVEKLIDWQMNERMNVERIYSGSLLSDLLILGTAIQYTGWRKTVRKVKRMETVSQPLFVEGTPVFGNAGEQLQLSARLPVQQEITVYDDPEVMSIDLFDFYVDSKAENIADARFCGHREYYSKKALQDLVKNAGWKIDWEKAGVEEEEAGSGKAIRIELNDKSLGEIDAGKNGMYLVHHYWENDRHMVIINNKYCALDEENPFWHGLKPYDKCCYCTLPHEFYGIGVPEMLYGLQSELNTVRNQRIDYNSMALRRMWKVRKGCGITPRDLIWRQNGIVQVNELDDVQEIQVADIPASAFTNESIIKQDMQDATGCRDVILGLAATNETATTTMTKDNNASIRFKDVVTAIIAQLLIPLGKKCLELDQQYMTEEKVFRLMDSRPMEIFSASPFELDGEYDVMYSGTAVDPIANKELQKQRMIEVLNVIQNNPLYQSNPQALTAVLREFFKAEGFRDYEEMLPQMAMQPTLPGQPMVEGQSGASRGGGMLNAENMTQGINNIVLGEKGGEI